VESSCSSSASSLMANLLRLMGKPGEFDAGLDSHQGETREGRDHGPTFTAP
jgi:hypothetical protein